MVNSLQRRTAVEYKWMMAASTPSMYEGRRRQRRRQQWRSDEVLWAQGFANHSSLPAYSPIIFDYHRIFFRHFRPFHPLFPGEITLRLIRHSCLDFFFFFFFFCLFYSIEWIDSPSQPPTITPSQCFSVMLLSSLSLSVSTRIKCNPVKSTGV